MAEEARGWIRAAVVEMMDLPRWHPWAVTWFQNLTCPEKRCFMLVVNSRIQIPKEEFEFTFTRSSGPGGQNVNKVNSKALLRWPILVSASLPDEVRARFITKYRTRMTDEGDLLISSQRYRDQGRNVQDCLDKLRELIAAVAQRPKARKATKPSRASRRRRLEGKRQQSEKKESRKHVRGEG